jgi:hypothetical protein
MRSIEKSRSTYRTTQRLIPENLNLEPSSPLITGMLGNEVTNITFPQNTLNYFFFCRDMLVLNTFPSFYKKGTYFMYKYIMSLSYYIFYSTPLKFPNLIRFTCLKIFGNFGITLTLRGINFAPVDTHGLEVTRDNSY